MPYTENTKPEPEPKAPAKPEPESEPKAPAKPEPKAPAKPRIPAVERLRQELAKAEEKERAKLAKQTELLQTKITFAQAQVDKANEKLAQAKAELDRHLASAPIVTDGVGIDTTDVVVVETPTEEPKA